MPDPTGPPPPGPLRVAGGVVGGVWSPGPPPGPLRPCRGVRFARSSTPREHHAGLVGGGEGG
eukprot:709100-Prorocentrum_minimum.AAC.1